MSKPTTKQRIYFMDVVGTHEEDVLEVLVGCRACQHRTMTQSLKEAKLWVHDHHADLHDIFTLMGVDMIGDVPVVEQAPHRDKSQDWEIVSKALETGKGLITKEDVMKLLEVSSQLAGDRIRTWIESGKIIQSGRFDMSITYCRTEDTHLYEDVRMLALMVKGPTPLPEISRRLGYVGVSNRVKALMKDAIEAGKAEKLGSGPGTLYQLRTN
jgi:hypothetical protein